MVKQESLLVAEEAVSFVKLSTMDCTPREVTKTDFIQKVVESFVTPQRIHDWVKPQIQQVLGPVFVRLLQ